jgi:hypothetical protein
MTEEVCAVCSCTVGEEAVEKDGVAYCCEPCAEGEPSECVTCAVAVDTPEGQEGGGG